jgi:hypothetical protein
MIHRVYVYIVCVTATCGILWYAQSLRSLDIDYLYSVARYTPPFGIAGTDPDALREAVDDLAQTRLTLAVSQDSILDAYYVYDALFPIRFLRALADLEEARLAFLDSQSLTRARTYLRHLSRVGGLGMSDAQLHLSARMFLANGSTSLDTPIYSLAGARTERTIIGSSQRIVETINEMRLHSDRIVNCTVLGYCPPPSRTQFITVPDAEYTAPSPVQRKIDDFLRREVPSSTFDRVSLLKSACLQILDQPYHMLLRTTPTGAPHVHTLNELFFYDAGSSTGATLSYLNTRDVQYAAYRSMNFYICPGTQHDYGMVFALTEAKKLFDIYIPVESDGTLYEPHVRDSIEKHYATERVEDERRTMEELLLMFDQRNAKLDILIGTIARSLQVRAAQSDTGIPVDISAHTLFLTMSAYSSLFLAHSTDIEAASFLQTRPTASEILSAFNTSFIKFSSLIERVGIEQLLDDMRTVRSFDTGNL